MPLLPMRVLQLQSKSNYTRSETRKCLARVPRVGPARCPLGNVALEVVEMGT